MNVESVNDFEEALREAASLERLEIRDLTAKEVRAVDWDRLGKFTNVTSLELSDLLLDELPPSLTNLIELRSIKLEKTRKLDWTQAFNVLAKLPKLEEIDLKLVKLETIPDEITQCAALSRLFLFEPKFKELPQAVYSLENLDTLSICFGSVPSISDDLGRMTGLTSLSLKNIDLKELPPAIGKLDCLQILSLSSNKLKELPNTIGELSSLTKLCLDGNQIRKLPEGFAKLESLQRLSYSRNGLKNVPPPVCRLRSLTELWLLSNDLRELPEALTEPPLEVLQLLGNKNLDPDSLPPPLKKIARF
jgi:internalin A